MSATISTSIEPLADVIAYAQARLPEWPSWLGDLQRKNLEIHRQLGIPTTKAEEWKYTPLRDVNLTEWQPGEPGPAWFAEPIKMLTSSPFRLVLVNGRLDRNLSDFPSRPGLRVMSIRDAIIENVPGIEAYLGKIAATERHTFAALSTALFVDGIYIHLDESAVVAEVIEIVHVSTGDELLIAPRVLIVAEANSQGSVLETYQSNGRAKTLTLPVTEVFVGTGAKLEHVRVQDEQLGAIHIALWEIRQEAKSEYRSCNVCFGAKLGRTDQNIDLQGEHVISRLDGVVVAMNQQILDNHTALDHALPHGNSFEIYKQVVGDEGTVVFNGKILVHQDAQKTDAKQTNQALLLSPQATINSKPQLEIFADDVKCTHGATVGQLEDQPLYYLMSRGIPEEQARAILVYAFAAEVIELISDEEIKGKLESRLFQKLKLESGQ